MVDSLLPLRPAAKTKLKARVSPARSLVSCKICWMNNLYSDCAIIQYEKSKQQQNNSIIKINNSMRISMHSKLGAKPMQQPISSTIPIQKTQQPDQTKQIKTEKSFFDSCCGKKETKAQTTYSFQQKVIPYESILAVQRNSQGSILHESANSRFAYHKQAHGNGARKSINQAVILISSSSKTNIGEQKKEQSRKHLQLGLESIYRQVRPYEPYGSARHYSIEKRGPASFLVKKAVSVQNSERNFRNSMPATTQLSKTELTGIRHSMPVTASLRKMESRPSSPRVSDLRAEKDIRSMLINQVHQASKGLGLVRFTYPNSVVTDNISKQGSGLKENADWKAVSEKLFSKDETIKIFPPKQQTQKKPSEPIIIQSTIKDQQNTNNVPKASQPVPTTITKEETAAKKSSNIQNPEQPELVKIQQAQ